MGLTVKSRQTRVWIWGRSFISWVSLPLPKTHFSSGKWESIYFTVLLIVNGANTNQWWAHCIKLMIVIIAIVIHELLISSHQDPVSSSVFLILKNSLTIYLLLFKPKIQESDLISCFLYPSRADLCADGTTSLIWPLSSHVAAFPSLSLLPILHHHHPLGSALLPKWFSTCPCLPQFFLHTMAWVPSSPHNSGFFLTFRYNLISATRRLSWPPVLSPSSPPLAFCPSVLSHLILSHLILSVALLNLKLSYPFICLLVSG